MRSSMRLLAMCLCVACIIALGFVLPGKWRPSWFGVSPPPAPVAVADAGAEQANRGAAPDAPPAAPLKPAMHLTGNVPRTRPARAILGQRGGGAAPVDADTTADNAAGDLVPHAPAPLARDALPLVGADPVADEVWASAINDPTLPAEARKDLIEDLNEQGFADPKNVTQDDLPLILSRLELIEHLAPDALDDVNADAFAEAYKDLRNMATRLAEKPPAE